MKQVWWYIKYTFRYQLSKVLFKLVRVQCGYWWSESQCIITKQEMMSSVSGWLKQMMVVSWAELTWLLSLCVSGRGECTGWPLQILGHMTPILLVWIPIIWSCLIKRGTSSVRKSIHWCYLRLCHCASFTPLWTCCWSLCWSVCLSVYMCLCVGVSVTERVWTQSVDVITSA